MTMTKGTMATKMMNAIHVVEDPQIPHSHTMTTKKDQIMVVREKLIASRMAKMAKMVKMVKMAKMAKMAKMMKKIRTQL